MVDARLSDGRRVQAKAGHRLPPLLFQIWACLPSIRFSISNEEKNNSARKKSQGGQISQALHAREGYCGRETVTRRRLDSPKTAA